MEVEGHRRKDVPSLQAGYLLFRVRSNCVGFRRFLQIARTISRKLEVTVEYQKDTCAEVVTATMCSNVCRFIGLLPVLLLAAFLGSFGFDMQDGSSTCFFGSRFSNHDRLPAGVTDRRSLWSQKLSLGGHSLFNFAKTRHPLSISKPLNEEEVSTSAIPFPGLPADITISPTDVFSPSLSFSTSASITPTQGGSSGLAHPLPSVLAPMLQQRKHARPSIAPAPQRFHRRQTAPVPSRLPMPAPSPFYGPVLPTAPNSTAPQDCRQPCPDGYTYTTPGAPCGCVIPIHAQLRLRIKLETLFPLVSELARELANGLFLQINQVRVVGANAVDGSEDETDVNADFVPLATAFDNTTANLLSSRFWSHEVLLNETLFGNYTVIYVQYPGLPLSPPPPTGPRPMGVDVNSSKGPKISKAIIIVIASASAMIAVFFLGVIWILLVRHSTQTKSPPSIVGPLHAYSTTKRSAGGSMLSGSLMSSTSISFVSSMANYTGTARTFTLAELERATENFKSENIVGEGGFGRVYRGVLDDGCEIAVKVLTRDDQQGGREFVAEIEMLSRLHHRNLVKLIGICTEDHMRCLVYELIANGSVESHLHGSDKYTAPLDWGARVKIALGSARGLAYLHEDSNPRVIHRDFKASNILLEDDYTPKVSDFGLAKAATDGDKQHISTRVMGTFGYVAPEYAMTGHLLVKSDVYSYGVVLLELLSGRKPVDMSQPPGQENLVTWARPLLTSKERLELLVDPELNYKFPFDSYARVAAIASMCVQPEVSHRPFMGEVVQALKLVYSESDASDSGLDRCTSLSSDLVETRQTQFLNASLFNSINYDSGPLHPLDLDQQRPLSASSVLSGSGRYIRQLSGSFRRHSSSGPLNTSALTKEPWYGVGHAKAAGTMSEHGAARYVEPQSETDFYDLWP